jgi:hypothetical protein
VPKYSLKRTSHSNLPRTAEEIFLWAIPAALVVACDAPPPQPVGTSFIPCPTSAPGTPEFQSEIRPLVTAYPNAQNVQVATPIPPTFALETRLPVEEPGKYWSGASTSITRITWFTTTDSAEQVIRFYQDSLPKEGWNQGDEGSTSGTITFGYSAAGELLSARRNNRCAPTPENGLPAHGVEITITPTDTNGTTVEIKELYTPGF